MLISMLETTDKHNIDMVFAIIDSIWLARNLRIYENKTSKIQDTVEKAINNTKIVTDNTHFNQNMQNQCSHHPRLTSITYQRCHNQRERDIGTYWNIPDQRCHKHNCSSYPSYTWRLWSVGWSLRPLVCSEYRAGSLSQKGAVWIWLWNWG